MAEMTLFACDRCASVYANLDKVLAEPNAEDRIGPYYFCGILTSNDPLGCGGKIRELKVSPEQNTANRA